ncbi:MAG: 30S ribosomal protein S14 [Candidatus Hydrogenedens sp.]|nr:30S ribosomal protein S14 [Candidatus Hydrogenedentota bacterium]NLF56914.1 30S ribosomal protein S14 [Candidatus Hydrogenedens sp.]
MAKTSKLEKNKKIARLVVKHHARREALKALIKNPDTPFEERLEAVRTLAELPRNASPVRYRNRCKVNGRPRGYLRAYGMSRVSFRELALEGKIPGVTKSSW